MSSAAESRRRCPTCERVQEIEPVAGMAPPVDLPETNFPPANLPWANPAYLPFCSKRCREIDLYRWSKGRYAIVDPMTPETLAELDDDSIEGLPFDEYPE